MPRFRLSNLQHAFSGAGETRRALCTWTTTANRSYKVSSNAPKRAKSTRRCRNFKRRVSQADLQNARAQAFKWRTNRLLLLKNIRSEDQVSECVYACAYLCRKGGLGGRMSSAMKLSECVVFLMIFTLGFLGPPQKWVTHKLRANLNCVLHKT